MFAFVAGAACVLSPPPIGLPIAATALSYQGIRGAIKAKRQARRNAGIQDLHKLRVDEAQQVSTPEFIMVVALSSGFLW
jgi:hypothetical protein